ncbi:hypothetical protein RYX36_029799 [Vicia faba]
MCSSSKRNESAKPMEHYKRMQCWSILKKMIEGRDGRDLNDKKMIYSIGLEDIKAKLKLYSTPDEFANDMRLIFSNVLKLHSSRDRVYRIARNFSHTFEYRWRSLKREWALKEKIMNKIRHNMRRVSLRKKIMKKS